MYVSSSGSLLGGAEVCLLDVATRIRVQRWQPLVVVPVAGELSAALAEAGVACEVLPLGTFRDRGEIRRAVLLVRLCTAIVAGWRLRRLIRRQKVDIVHSNTSVVIAGALGARLAGVPHIWHVREVLDGRYWRVLRWLMVRLSVRQVCISRAVAETMSTASVTDGVVVIPDGIDLDLFSAGYGGAGPGEQPIAAFGAGDGGGPVVAMVSRIHPSKGHELFLRAARLALDDLPGTRFLLIGGHIPAYENLYRRLLALRHQLDLDRAATFVPFVERRELARFLSTLTVVVVPSTWIEPGGLVVLEGMASGTPVIATRRGGPAEAIEEGVSGFLVSHIDPAEMAARINELLRGSGLRSRFAAAGRRRVAEAYSLDQHVERIAALYAGVSPADRRSPIT